MSNPKETAKAKMPAMKVENTSTGTVAGVASGPSLLQQPVASNKNAHPKKRRGRPPGRPPKTKKNQDTKAGDVAGEKRARPARKKWGKFDGDEWEHEGNDAKVKSKYSLGDIDMDKQRKAQQENIRRQQAQAREMVKGLQSVVSSSPEALSMMHELILNQPNGIPFSLKNPKAADGYADHTLLFHQDQHGKGHGKTRVTTPGSNQHPQQGTVAPHLMGANERAEHSISAISSAAVSSAIPGRKSDAIFGTVVAPAVGADNIPTKTEQPQGFLTEKPTKAKGGRPKRKEAGPTVDQRKDRPTISIPDDDPRRIVNPLLNLPPPILPGPPHRQTIGAVAGGGSSHPTVGHLEPPAKNVMQAAELLAMTNLVFPRPDTYPIAQYARLLGFHVPDLEEATEAETFMPASSNDLPFKFIQDPIIHHIPPEGHYAERTWKAAYDGRDERDDCVLEGQVDPLYQSLLGASEDWTTTPNTGSGVGKDKGSGPLKNPLYHQFAKFKAAAPSAQRIQEVLEHAEEFGLVKTDRWRVAQVCRSNATTPTSGRSATPPPTEAKTPEQTGSVLESLPEVVCTDKAEAEETATAETATTAPPTTEAATESAAVIASGDVKPGGKDQNQLLAVAAWHDGREIDKADLSMVLHYRLQWCQLASESTNGNRVSELVMRIPFGPVPIILGQANALCPPKTEEDYFDEEFSKNNNRDGLTMRKRLIVILYALVLEHARNCAVCYCLLQVPPSLVSLLRTHFRMTPVPLKDNSTFAPTDKRTTLIPMLCDLQKCSTRYALLVQKETLKGENNAMASKRSPPTRFMERLLVRLPTTQEVNSAMANSPYSILPYSMTQPRAITGAFRCPPPTLRQACVRMRVTRSGEDVATTPSATTPPALKPGEASSAVTAQGGTLPANDDVKETGETEESDNKQEEGVPGATTLTESKAAPGEAQGSGAMDSTGTDVPVASLEEAQPAKEKSSKDKKEAEILCKQKEGAAASAPATTEENAVAPVSPTREGAAKGSSTAATSQERKPGAVEGDTADGALKENLPGEDSNLVMTLKVKDDQGQLTENITKAPQMAYPLRWDILKTFPVVKPLPNLPSDAPSMQDVRTPEQGLNEGKGASGVLKELKRKQQELVDLERDTLEPKISVLLGKAIEERRHFEECDHAKKLEEQARVLATNQKMQSRRKELDDAWQEQLEQDMDAVCEICNDGEVTPDNQILFCEACNVAVHQLCYGIERVPEGDYYCLACQHFDRKKVNSAAQRQMRYQQAAAAQAAGETNLAAIFQQRQPVQVLPMCCELCPIPNGAFVPTDNSKRHAVRLREKDDANKSAESGAMPDDSRWVHMVCAKWQGLNFVDSAKPNLLVEDVHDLKTQYRLLGYKCVLCLGERGAFNKCQVDGCENSLHVLCARSSGLCDVVHGEDAKGNIDADPWTLKCPAHSRLPRPAIDQKTIVPVTKLVMLAESFPPEPIVNQRVIYANARPDKPFNKLTGKEREEAFYNVDYEQDLINELAKKLFGVRCEVCDQWEEDGKNLTRCQCCGVVVCDSCVVEGDNVVPDKRFKYRCTKCTYMAETRKQNKDGTDEVPEPSCAVCCQKGGWLRKAQAVPISKKVWKGKEKLLAKSLFGPNVWCHNLCALWCAPTKLEINEATGIVSLTQVVLSNGSGFIKPKDICFLCGNTRGLKEPCVMEDCFCADKNGNRPVFHPTCARQTGLEVKDDSSMATLFHVKCYRHGGNDFNLRARLEDLMEIETKRAGRGFVNQDAPMTFADASRLLNGAVLVLRVLGWAWRWSEWWVQYGSNWEPLLEAGQSEKHMTKEQLKIVDSTQESRSEDARRCRLAAFGAALRNRSYDTDDKHAYDYIGGFDHKALEQALRAVLSTKSLVGPLQAIEIEFLVDWLGRAYRSRSRLLGFGDDKIDIAQRTDFCNHHKDGSPKFELRSRPLPGKQGLVEGHIFEDAVDEVDDFDYYIQTVAAAAVVHDNRIKEKKVQAPTKRNSAKKKRGRPLREPESKHTTREPAVKRGPGRPPTAKRGRPVGRPKRKREPEDVKPEDVEPDPERRIEEFGSHEESRAPLKDRIQRGRKRRRLGGDNALESNHQEVQQTEAKPGEETTSAAEPSKSTKVQTEAEEKQRFSDEEVSNSDDKIERTSLEKVAANSKKAPADVVKGSEPQRKRKRLGVAPSNPAKDPDPEGPPPSGESAPVSSEGNAQSAADEGIVKEAPVEQPGTDGGFEAVAQGRLPRKKKLRSLLAQRGTNNAEKAAVDSASRAESDDDDQPLSQVIARERKKQRKKRQREGGAMTTIVRGATMRTDESDVSPQTAEASRLDLKPAAKERAEGAVKEELPAERNPESQALCEQLSGVTKQAIGGSRMVQLSGHQSIVGKDAGTERSQQATQNESETSSDEEERPATVEVSNPRDKRDALLLLSKTMQSFLTSQKIKTAEVFMASRSKELGVAFSKWRKKKGLPVLKGSGPVATISASKGQIRRIIQDRGLDPLPEMTRTGMSYPGRESAREEKETGQGNESSGDTSNEPVVQHREGKRQSRRPDFFTSPGHRR